MTQSVSKLGATFGTKFAKEVKALAQQPLIRLIRELYKQGYPLNQIAKWAGVDKSVVTRLLQEVK